MFIVVVGLYWKVSDLEIIRIRCSTRRVRGRWWLIEMLMPLFSSTPLASLAHNGMLSLLLDAGLAVSSLLQRHRWRLGLEALAEVSYLVFGDPAQVDLGSSQESRCYLDFNFESHVPDE